MKKYMIGMLMAVFVFIAVLPQQVSAAESVPEAVLLKKEGEKEASVKLRLPNAAGEKISSLQVSLKMEAGAEAGFSFDEMITERAKVYENILHKDTGVMNIYIAGTEPLYREGEDTLTIGKVSVSSVPAKITAEDVGIVRGTDVEKLDLSATITLGETPATPTPTTTATPTPATPTPATPTPATPTPTATPKPTTPKPTATPKPTTPKPTTPTPSASVKTPKTPKVTKLTNKASGITIKWGKTANTTGYRIYRKTAGKKWSKIATVKGINKVSYTDKTVRSKNGTKYFYSVQAYNSKKASSYNKKGTQIVRMTAPALSKPEAKGTGKMLVKWKRNKKATGYQIQYCTSSKFKKNWTKERVRSGKVTAVVASGLKSDKTYYVRIRSYKKVGSKYYYSAWGTAKKVAIR